MLSGPGRASGDVENVESTTNRRPRRKFRRSKEKMNPHNIEFQRQVAAIEARQQERRQMFHVLHISPVDLYMTLSALSPQPEEDGLSLVPSQSAAMVDGLEPPSSIIMSVATPEESYARCLIDSSRPLEAQSQVLDKAPDSDFLDDTFFKKNAKPKHATRNKNKKKNKKNKRRRCRKEQHAHEMNENHEDDVLLEATPPSTPVNEVSMGRPDFGVGWSRPTNEVELPRTTTSYFQFSEQSSSSNFKWSEPSMNASYTDNCWNFSVGIESIDNMLIGNNEFPCAPSKLADSGNFRSGGGQNWTSKSNDGNSVCLKNDAGACCDTQQVQRCGDASHDDDDFQLVMSRKSAQKMKRMHLLGYSSGSMASSSRPNNVWKQPQHGATLENFIKNLTQKSSQAQQRAPHEVTLLDYITAIDIACFSGPRESYRGKSKKGPVLTELITQDSFTEDNSVGREGMLQGTVHPRKSDDGQMAPRSASSYNVANMDYTCTSGRRPTRDGKLKALLSGDGNVIYTDSTSPFPAMTLSLGYVDNSPCAEQTEQKKHLRSQSGQHKEAPADAADEWPSEDDLDGACLALPTVEENNNMSKQIVGCSTFDLTEIVKAANEAYRIQAASDEQLISGHPIADIDTFLHSATPVVGHISCITCCQCLQDLTVRESACHYQISNVCLRSVWQWYEEPGSFGLNVEINNGFGPTKLTCSGSEFSKNFVPSLSAIQLFGQSKKNLVGMFDKEEASLFEQDHVQLLFEYFESDNPSSRLPLFKKIKQLVGDANISGTQVFGDPTELEYAKLSDLHPASWFCVAWYPIYRIPQGNCHAAFLTYHCLGKLVPQTCTPDIADGQTYVVSPVVGLSSYNDKGEHWFQLRDDVGMNAVSSDGSSKTNRAEVLKERLTALRRGASVMSRAAIPKATGESINNHPDYEFFRSRSN